MSHTSGRLPPETWADVQGLVTSGYGSLPYSAYLWLTITNAGARRWLADAIPIVQTSAQAPPAGGGGERYGEIAVNVAFTAEGLAGLGLPETAVKTFPAEFVEGVATPNRSAILGDTGDSAPEHWELGGPSTAPVGALLVIHARTESALDRACADVRRGFNVAGGAVVEIHASAQRGHRPLHHREPFGFRDGISQPAIQGRRGRGVPTGEFILGYPNHYGNLPPTPVVPAAMDPAGLLPAWPNPYQAPGSLRDLGRNGTYLVYRKLAQDVAGFWQFVTREAHRLTEAGYPETAVTLASKMVGRWPDGTPLAAADGARHGEAVDQDAFSYRNDPDGLACPWGAHIRRTNPRDAIKPYDPESSVRMSEAHRLLRRGRVYGEPLFDAERFGRSPDASAIEDLGALQDDGEERGIHFLCINASIRSQFEFVQQSWCNSPHFGALTGNPDPIIGGNGQPDEPTQMLLPRPEGVIRTSPLPRFVRVRAGVYLFMPGMSALKFLASMR
jgi:deferrochelatase/peroxidase EfeB